MKLKSCGSCQERGGSRGAGWGHRSVQAPLGTEESLFHCFASETLHGCKLQPLAMLYSLQNFLAVSEMMCFMLIPTLLIHFNTAFSVSFVCMPTPYFTSMLIHFSRNRIFK